MLTLLLDERVPISNLGRIMESLAVHATTVKDPGELAERFAKTTSWEQVAEPGGLEPASTAGSPHDDIERWEATKQLADAIEALPENERLVVTLYYREDLRLKEISEVLKLSISRISRILTKATFELGEALRSRLGPQAVREGC